MTRRKKNPQQIKQALPHAEPDYEPDGKSQHHCCGLPGSKSRKLAYRYRVENDLEIHHENDRDHYSEDLE